MNDNGAAGDAPVVHQPLKVSRAETEKKKLRSPSKRSPGVPASGCSSSPAMDLDSSRVSGETSRRGCRRSGVRFSSKSNIVSYDCRVPSHTPALLIGSHALRAETSDYFEIEILEMDESSFLGIGLVPSNHPLDQYPGIGNLSFGYNAVTGRVHWGHCPPAIAVHGSHVSRTARPGDRIGCAIKKERSLFSASQRDQSNNEPLEQEVMETRVLFFMNGKKIASNAIPHSILHNDFFPVIALSCPGDEVKLLMNHHFVKRRTVSSVTNNLESLSLDHESNHASHVNTFAEGKQEDSWSCFSHIRATDSILEYFGPGKEVAVGQAKVPLDPFNHYFQVQVLDVGQFGSICVGVTQNGIPLQTKAGCYPHSVAYHLDSGLIFTGSVKGEQFGPKGAVTGDIIGCGIVYPLDFPSSREPSKEEPKEEDKSFSPSPSQPSEEEASEEGDDLSDSDKEPKMADDTAGSVVSKKSMVDIFFTRNGVILGQRKMEYPVEGFFPIIGLSSPGEKIIVDLHPLSG